MKKLLFSTALLLSFCYLIAQPNNSQKEKQSTTAEVLYLQKSNALLRTQLKEQKHTLLKQIQKTDSIISILQSTTSEIKKGADNQNSNTQSIYTLQKQTTSIFQALSQRKLYAIIAFIGSIIIVLIYLFYMNTKLVAINKKIKQNEEISNKQIADMKDIINKMNIEINNSIEKEIAKIKNDLSTNMNEINERLKKTSLVKPL